MTPNHGLAEKVLRRIIEVLERHPEIEQAILFGSRAKGTHRPGSDIDLALSGQALDWRKLGRIDEDLDDLLLPYTFRLIHLSEATDPDIRAHIARVGITLHRRAQPKTCKV